MSEYVSPVLAVRQKTSITFHKKILPWLFDLRRLLGLAVFLILWELAPRFEWVDPTFLPPFSVVLGALGDMAVSGEIFKHLGISLFRSLTGFGIALVVAIPLGLVIGWFSRVSFYLTPLFETFRQTSVLALFPVFILFFGIGEVSKIMVIFWGVQWPILLNTISGVRNVDPLLIKSARSMGTKNTTLFVKVILPSAIPTIFTGIRLSATVSILVLVAAEMMGASAGLGYLLFDSQAKFQIPKMYAAIVSMALLGLVVNGVLGFIENKISFWKDDLGTKQ